MDELLKALLAAGSDEAKMADALKPVLGQLDAVKAEKAAAEEKALREAGKIEDLYKLKLDEANAQASKTVAGLQEQIAKLSQSVGSAKKAQSLAAIAQLQDKIGFHPAAAGDILASLQGIDVDDEFNVKIEGGLEKAINSLRESKPYLFLQSQGVKMPQGRADAAGMENPFLSETFSLTKQAELFKANPERARALAKQAGIEI